MKVYSSWKETNYSTQWCYENYIQVNVVNLIATIKGGTHVDYVTNQITNYVMSIVNKKNKNANLKAHAVKNHLWVFVNALIGNPAFDSQTKGTLTIRTTHRNGKVLAFYSMSEYESWKESLGGNASGWSIKYYKVCIFVIIVVICNAAAMEALPIFLYSLITAWGAILILVTLILLFGEIIPQSVCSRYGLAIGAVVAPFVCILVWICFPVAYPIRHVHVALFRRAELKTLVDLHGNELCEGNIGTLEEWTMEMIKLQLLFKLNCPFEVASRGYSFIIGFSKALALHEVIIACLALINTIASHYSDGQVAPDIETDASLSMLPWPKPAVWPLVPPDAPSEVFEKEKDQYYCEDWRRFMEAEGDDDDAEADDDETDKDADITEESAHDEL
ncbi:unnamed protein product [Camellia sinensis]